MMLIAREELIVGVVEGTLLAFIIVYLVGGLVYMTGEAVANVRAWLKHRRNERILNRILEGKQP